MKKIEELYKSTKSKIYKENKEIVSLYLDSRKIGDAKKFSELTSIIIAHILFLKKLLHMIGSLKVGYLSYFRTSIFC